ncbi:MAG: hypothetical protein JEZ09_05865 [Salinivirgaceae bacterium]|nr:hypothetical protein [Salinivirgaceae bacterium]
MRNFLIIPLILVSSYVFSQTQDSVQTLSLLFMGDIMGHDTQIASALQTDGT